MCKYSKLKDFLYQSDKKHVTYSATGYRQHHIFAPQMDYYCQHDTENLCSSVWRHCALKACCCVLDNKNVA